MIKSVYLEQSYVEDISCQLSPILKQESANVTNEQLSVTDSKLNFYEAKDFRRDFKLALTTM
jgi:hypothetical protein